MGIGLPPPVERPNPYATFVRTFLAARNAQREYQDNEDRLKIAKEEEKARREAEKNAKEEFKQQQELRQSEFEFQKLDSERKFKQSELAHQWDRAQAFKNMRNPTPGKPFSLQLPMGVDQPPMDVQPVTYDDLQQSEVDSDARHLSNSMALKAAPGEAPETYQIPPGFGLPGIDGTSQPAPIIAAATSMHNARQAAAAQDSRGERDRAPVVLRDIVGNVTGVLNRQTMEITPIGQQGMRTATAPSSEFDKLDEGTAALNAVNAVKDGVVEFQRTSILNPIDKAMSSVRLNNTMTALSRTVGRAMGEKGVFTDQDKADFTKFLGPGIIFSTLAPEEQTKRIELADGLIKKMIKTRVKTFYQRYGSLPEDKMKYLEGDPLAIPNRKTDPGGLFR